MPQPKAIQGKDDWLFLDNDSNRVIQQITGDLIFSDRRLQQWQFVLETRYLWLREKGIPYFFLIAPNKECVYPEYLPEGVHLSSARCINQLSQHLQAHSFFKIIYPLPELAAAKAGMLVYRKQDTHWNAFGAFTAYQSLTLEIAKLRQIFILQPEVLRFFECQKAGDLGTKLGIRQETTIDVEFLQGKIATCVFNNQVRNQGNLMIFEHPDRTLPKAVFFRDSFASDLLPFLAESFSKLVVAWQPNLDYILIQQEQPDLVISQQIERYLTSIPNDSHGPTNAEIVREKMISEKK